MRFLRFLNNNRVIYLIPLQTSLEHGFSVHRSQNIIDDEIPQRLLLDGANRTPGMRRTFDWRGVSHILPIATIAFLCPVYVRPG